MTTPLLGANEAAAKLAALLISLDHSVKRDAANLRRTDRTRINMLLVHAGAAIVIAPLFAFSRHAMVGPQWDWLLRIPGFPQSFAALFWAGGVILLPATLARNRRWETVGLAIISFWYSMLSVGFTIPVVSFAYRCLAGQPVPDNPNFYAWAVYAHLAVIMGVHLLTLWRMLRAKVKPANRYWTAV